MKDDGFYDGALFEEVPESPEEVLPSHVGPEDGQTWPPGLSGPPHPVPVARGTYGYALLLYSALVDGPDDYVEYLCDPGLD